MFPFHWGAAALPWCPASFEPVLPALPSESLDSLARVLSYFPMCLFFSFFSAFLPNTQISIISNLQKRWQ